MIRLQRLTDPAAEPLTLAQAKLYLRIEDDVTEEDDLVEALVASARDYAERYCNRSWASADWRAIYDGFPSLNYRFCLLDPGVTSLTSVKYLDADNAEETLVSGTDFTYDPVRQLVIPVDNWPTGSSSVVIEYEAGPDHTASPPPIMPKGVLAAIRLVLTDLYENRSAQEVGTIISANKAVEALLNQHRVGWGI